jgi:excisionase family DNA binding protein
MSDSPVVLLTPEQAAEALGIGRWKLYDLLRQGRLRSMRIGSCRRISTEALREFVEDRERAEHGCPDLGVGMSRGYGSVYRKGSGWEASAYIEGRRRSVRGRTMREARDKLRAMQERARAGEPITDARLSVAEYLEYWLAVVESTVRPRTFVRYRELVRIHAVPIIGHIRLAELKPMHLQQLYAKRLQAGSSPSTGHHLHAVLHRAPAMGERWEQVNRNVARLVTPPRVPPAEDRAPDPRLIFRPQSPDAVIPSNTIVPINPAATAPFEGWSPVEATGWVRRSTAKLDPGPSAGPESPAAPAPNGNT